MNKAISFLRKYRQLKVVVRYERGSILSIFGSNFLKVGFHSSFLQREREKQDKINFHYFGLDGKEKTFCKQAIL